MTDSGRLSRWTLRYIALGYLTVLLLLPIGVALVKTFDEGIGEVNQIGGKLVRPHDLEILPVAADGTIEARVERIVTLGFSGRVELLIEGDHREAWAQLTRHEIDDLNLAENQLVYIRPRPDAVTKEDTGVVDAEVGITEDPPASDRPTAAGSGLPV